jgi:hypothetical protein
VPRFPDWDWYFLYTREAHPGENLPAHATFDDKLAAARRLRDELGISRTILVDDLEGSVHRAYGLMPNMTWVLGRSGLILYKAPWTSVARVAEFLERQQQRPSGRSIVPLPTEQLETRDRNDEAFMRGLERNGPRAVAEWQRALEFWTAEARAGRRGRG